MRGLRRVDGFCPPGSDGCRFRPRRGPAVGIRSTHRKGRGARSVPRCPLRGDRQRGGRFAQSTSIVGSAGRTTSSISSGGSAAGEPSCISTGARWLAGAPLASRVHGDSSRCSPGTGDPVVHAESAPAVRERASSSRIEMPERQPVVAQARARARARSARTIRFRAESTRPEPTCPPAAARTRVEIREAPSCASCSSSRYS